MGNDQTCSDASAMSGGPIRKDSFPRAAISEKHEVKSPLLNALKTAHKGISKDFLEIEASLPILSSPSEHKLLQKVHSSEQQPSTFDRLVWDYDSTFFKGQSEYADELVKKNRFLEQMKEDNFSRQILFAYCFPKEKHLNRAAKKFAHQAMKRSLNVLAKNEVSALEQYSTDIIVEYHRNELREIIVYAMQKSYHALFTKAITHLPENQQAVLMGVFYHPEMRSYLEPKTKELFYQLERQAAEKSRKIHGAPFDYAIETGACKAPKKLSEWLFSEEIGWQNLLQDHLYFYQTYKSQIDKQFPPLLQKEKQLLTQTLAQQGGVLPGNLKTTHDICCRESRAIVIAKFSDLQSSWNYNPDVLALALEIEHSFKNEIATINSISKEDSESLLCYLKDRSCSEVLNKNSLKKQFEDLLTANKKQTFNLNEDFNKAITNSYFLLQLEQEIGPIDLPVLEKLINSTVEAHDKESEYATALVNKCITNTQITKALPLDWKPSIQQMKAIANVESRAVLYQKLNIKYLNDLKKAYIDTLTEFFDRNSPQSKSIHSLLEIFSQMENEAYRHLCLNLATHPKAFPSLCEKYRMNQQDEGSRSSQTLRNKFQQWLENPSNKQISELSNIPEIFECLVTAAISPSYSEIFTPILIRNEDPFALTSFQGSYIDASTGQLESYLERTYSHALSADSKNELSGAIAYARQIFYGYLSGMVPKQTLIQKFSKFVEEIIFEKCGNICEAKIARFASFELMENIFTIVSTTLVLLKSGITPVAEVSSSQQSPIKREFSSTTNEDLMEKVRHHWNKESHQYLSDPTMECISKEIAKEAFVLADTLGAVYDLPSEFQDTLIKKISIALSDLEELLAPNTFDDTILRSLKHLANGLIAYQEEEDITSCIAFRQYFSGIYSATVSGSDDIAGSTSSYLFCAPERNFSGSIVAISHTLITYAANLELLKVRLFLLPSEHIPKKFQNCVFGKEKAPAVKRW